MRLRRSASVTDGQLMIVEHRTGAAPVGLHATVLDLQRSVGNSAVAELLASRAVGIQRDAGPSGGPAPRRSSLFDGKGLALGDPEQFLRDRPTLAPAGGLPSLPADAVSGLIDWGDIGSAYADRRLVLQGRDRAVISEHYLRWYPVAQALYRLPLAARLFDSPAAIMNTMTARMIDASLAGNNLTMFEQFDREAARFGASSTTASVTVKRF